MLTRTCRGPVVVATLALSLLLASSVQAVTIEVNSRAALAGNDFINWGTAGDGGQPNPLTISSTGGITTTVEASATIGSAELQVLTQSATWFGNFAPGDKVLFSNPQFFFNAQFFFDPLMTTISFDSPVSGEHHSGGPALPA